jgi:hypothetical protein
MWPYARENAPHLGRKWYKFPCVMQINTKFANFAGLYFPHFVTELCKFTNFNMLFLAVVMDFVLLAQIKI